MRFVTLLLCCLVSGCASLNFNGNPLDTFPSKPLEATWQTLNAIDYSQTVNTARRPDCGYYEKAWPTAEIIGEHPSVSGVGAMWALDSASHLFVSAWLDREVDATDSDGWRAIRLFWHALRLADTAHNIVDNHHIGLKPFGSGCRQ